MPNEFAKQQAMMAAEANYNVLGRRQQPSHRQRYEAMRDELKARLGEVESALAALDAHPELEQFIEIIGRVGL